ncbi:MAG: magnesium transporter [Spirosomataceae bacterium]
MPFELTKEYIEHLETAIEQEDEALIKAEMEELYPADISSILSELDGKKAHYVLGLLDVEVGAEIISELEEDIQLDFLKHFSSKEIAKYVNILDSDDAVDLLKEQPIQIREEVIALLEDREQARFVLDLLPYEEDCAGGLMQKELVKINVKQTVTECVEEIRRQAEDVEKVYAVYVVDDDGTLLGIVSLKRIILAKRGSKIENIYDDDIIFVHTYDSAEEVADTMQKYNLEVIPVVNVQNRLLGRITIDDVLDVITEQAQEDIQAITGVSADVEEDDSVWDITKARLPWLAIGMMGSLAAAKFLGIFEHDLLRMIPALALFIPIVGSTGGNVGIQTSSFMVQILSDKSGMEIGYPQRLFKIILIALLKGLLISTFVFLVTFLLLGHPLKLATVVSVSLFSVVLLSSFTGTITPIILNRFGVNPSVASGPFITTANDFLGYSVYFGIAYLLYNL